MLESDKTNKVVTEWAEKRKFKKQLRKHLPITTTNVAGKS